MKRLMFELSMPSNNSWNGKWSGAERKYTLAKTVTDKKADTLDKQYTHCFGDGWVACVTVRQAKPRERATNKFCGYNWMIDDILYKGKIK
jgi:hypothetical protein